MNAARFTGLAMLATAAALFVGGTYSDPGMESGDDPVEFGQEAVAAAERVPGIMVGQAVQIALAMLTVLAGAGLWALIRRNAPATAAIGTGTLALAGIFSAVQGLAGTGIVAAAVTYADGGLLTAGDPRSLELIRVLGLIHWASWLATAVALGVALIALGWALAWTVHRTPRWLGAAGLVGGSLLVLSPLALAAPAYYLGLMAGMILTLAWLTVAGASLLLRPGPPATMLTGETPPTRAAVAS